MTEHIKGLLIGGRGASSGYVSIYGHFFFLAQILVFEFQAINFSSRLLQASYQHLSTNSEWILMCGALRWFSLISVCCVFRVEFCTCNNKNKPEELLIHHLNEKMGLRVVWNQLLVSAYSQDVWKSPASVRNLLTLTGLRTFFLHRSFRPRLPGKSLGDILRFIFVSLASVHCCILPPTNSG